MYEPKIILNRLKIKRGMNYSDSEIIEAAYDSKKNKVDIRKLSSEGYANSALIGEYPIIFSFIDPYTNEKVQAMSVVTVV